MYIYVHIYIYVYAHACICTANSSRKAANTPVYFPVFHPLSSHKSTRNDHPHPSRLPRVSAPRLFQSTALSSSTPSKLRNDTGAHVAISAC